LARLVRDWKSWVLITAIFFGLLAASSAAAGVPAVASDKAVKALFTEFEFRTLTKKLDQAAAKGTVHVNLAARVKSRISAHIKAAKAGGMACIGVARLDDTALLRSAGADWVVTRLDELPIDTLEG